MLARGWLGRNDLIADLGRYLEETGMLGISAAIDDLIDQLKRQPRPEHSMLGAFAAKYREPEAHVEVARRQPRSGPGIQPNPHVGDRLTDLISGAS